MFFLHKLKSASSFDKKFRCSSHSRLTQSIARSKQQATAFKMTWLAHPLKHDEKFNNFRSEFSRPRNLDSRDFSLVIKSEKVIKIMDARSEFEVWIKNLLHRHLSSPNDLRGNVKPLDGSWHRHHHRTLTVDSSPFILNFYFSWRDDGLKKVN